MFIRLCTRVEIEGTDVTIGRMKGLSYKIFFLTLYWKCFAMIRRKWVWRKGVLNSRGCPKCGANRRHRYYKLGQPVVWVAHSVITKTTARRQRNWEQRSKLSKTEIVIAPQMWWPWIKIRLEGRAVSKLTEVLKVRVYSILVQNRKLSDHKIIHRLGGTSIF